MLDNMKAYYVYTPLVLQGRMNIDANTITPHTWNDHNDGIFNIISDCIETDYARQMIIDVYFQKPNITDNDADYHVELRLFDYFINLLFWYPIIALNDEKLHPKHLFFKDAITRKDIKDYMDTYFILPRRLIYPNIILNNIIADTLKHFSVLDEFSMYLSNTLNLEDSIELMTVNQEYNGLLHADLSTIPLELVKKTGMDLVYRSKDIIMNAEKFMTHEHCLRAPFASGEGISLKQYKDNSINIGTKPDGQGSIYHEVINRSYITGGLNDLLSQYIDSASARVAQIISKKNVGDSGGFSRILGLNNVDTFLHQDPTFDCGTNNYLEVDVINKDVFKLLFDRYYKENLKGPLKKICREDTHLIGKKIYLRSPIFCASHALGHGICYHCYGDLAYINNDINIGRIASELITSQYIQMRLSAKHLLEANIKDIIWCESFYNFFYIDINSIKIRTDLPELDNWQIMIKFNDIQVEKDDDFFKHKYTLDGMHDTKDEIFYNEYVTNFTVIDPNGNSCIITAEVNDELEDINPTAKFYITSALGQLLRSNISIDDDEDEIYISVSNIKNLPLFVLKMENNDLGKSLDMFTDLINKKAVTKRYNAHSLINRLYFIVLKGGISTTSVHLEVLVSNQIRNADDILSKPNWYNINEPYQVLTLNDALRDNPSIIVSLTYRKLARALNYPLSFEKYGSSIFDLFFMRKPKKMVNIDREVLDLIDDPYLKPGESPVMKVKDNTQPRPVNVEEFIKPYRTQYKTKLDD